MRYPPGHRDATRAAIVRAARRLFNRFGFDAVSVDRIMAGAGLTRGGFYRHFDSKTELYSEALKCFFTDPGWESNWDGIEIDRGAAEVGPQIVRAYLSREHFENVEDSCPMVALPSDVARSDASAKRAFEQVFKAMVDILERDSCGAGRDRIVAHAIAALCVGGMVIARASDDRAFAEELRAACMRVALRLGGWD
jgi:AcrR family transcriptional regulator